MAGTAETAGADGAHETGEKLTTLVMLSGGIDSVHVLAKLLAGTDDTVIAHHIHFLNAEGRHKAEGQACQRVVAYCRERYRPFHFTQSAIDRRQMSHFGLDVFSAAFEVGFLARSYRKVTGRPVDRWALGFCLEEKQERLDDPDAEARRGHMLDLVAASSFPEPPPALLTLPLLTKAEQMAFMGEELTSLCWTCRRPVESGAGTFSECGECKTCKLMTRVRESA